jgi:hypothetical protein
MLQNTISIRKAKPDELAGLEIFEIHPVILGGSPTDPANKVALTRQKHIDAVRYWNRKIRELRRDHRRST